jgi:hypothetical protein
MRAKAEIAVFVSKLIGFSRCIKGNLTIGCANKNSRGICGFDSLMSGRVDFQAIAVKFVKNI